DWLALLLLDVPHHRDGHFQEAGERRAVRARLEELAERDDRHELGRLELNVGRDRLALGGVLLTAIGGAQLLQMRAAGPAGPARLRAGGGHGVAGDRVRKVEARRVGVANAAAALLRR